MIYFHDDKGVHEQSCNGIQYIIEYGLSSEYFGGILKKLEESRFERVACGDKQYLDDYIDKHETIEYITRQSIVPFKEPIQLVTFHDGHCYTWWWKSVVKIEPTKDYHFYNNKCHD